MKPLIEFDITLKHFLERRILSLKSWSVVRMILCTGFIFCFGGERKERRLLMTGRMIQNMKSPQRLQ